MAFASYPALLRAKTDAATALSQLSQYIQSSPSFSSSKSAIDARRADLISKHQKATEDLMKLEQVPSDGVMTSSFIVGMYRRVTEEMRIESLVCNEAISKCVHFYGSFPSRPSCGVLTDCVPSSAAFAPRSYPK